MEYAPVIDDRTPNPEAIPLSATFRLSLKMKSSALPVFATVVEAFAVVTAVKASMAESVELLAVLAELKTPTSAVKSSSAEDPVLTTASFADEG